MTSEAPVLPASPLARAPSAHHVAALDGVRGLAVLLVFVYHYGGGTHAKFLPLKLFGFVNKGGWCGVTLFFVLSGFLITGILWDNFTEPHWWRKFVARRSLRIFPLYYFALLLCMLAAVADGTLLRGLSRLWIPALFLQTFPRLVDLSQTIEGTFHLWTIAVEEQFYLLWPLLLFLAWRSSPGRSRSGAQRLCVAVVLLSLGFRVAVWSLGWNPAEWLFFLPSQAGALAAGGWLALAFRGPEWVRVLRIAPAAVLLGLAGFLAIGFAVRTFENATAPMQVGGLLLLTVAFSGLVALALRPGRVERAFRARWITWLGKLSYGIYVYHMLVRNIVRAAANAAGGLGGFAVLIVQFVLAAGLTLGLAWLSYNLMEKRFLLLKRYFLPRSETPASELAAASLRT